MPNFKEEEKKYKDFLFRKQNGLCANCGKPIIMSAILHHDPPRENPEHRLIDFEGKTRNRMLCRSCHMKIERPKLIMAQLERYELRDAPLDESKASSP